MGSVTKKLKVDFHTHTAEDPKDKIDYSARELIDRAAALGYDALAITNHNEVAHSRELESYAGRQGLLLLPGVEIYLSNKHVVVINPDFTSYPRRNSLDELKKIKSARNLVIAPHPFFPGFKSLMSQLNRYLPYFDAIEFSCYYNHIVNMNARAAALARHHEIPLVGDSDCHNIWQFGTTWTLVDAAKDLDSIIAAVKEGRVEVQGKPISLVTMTRIAVNFMICDRLGLPFHI